MGHLSRRSLVGLILLVSLLGIVPWAASFGQVAPDQAERIRKAVPTRATVAPKRPRTVLIWNTPPSLMEPDPHKGYTIPQGAFAFQTLGERTGAYHPVVSDDLAMFHPDKLETFDAIVLNNSSGPWIKPTEKDVLRLKDLGGDAAAIETVLRKSFVEFLDRGGGIVAVHYAIAANKQWPEFQNLIGGDFIGHPWNEEVGIHLEEPNHPLLRTFGGKDFRLADEIYEFGDVFDRSKVRALMALDPKVSNMKVPWIHRKDHDFPQAWIKAVGKGRVLYCGFGHRTEIWWNAPVLAFYLDAVQFACGDIEAPTDPRPSR